MAGAFSVPFDSSDPALPRIPRTLPPDCPSDLLGSAFFTLCQVQVIPPGVPAVHAGPAVMVVAADPGDHLLQVFPDLFQQFPVLVSVLFLDHQGTQRHTRRLCRHSCITGEQFRVFFLYRRMAAAFFPQRFSGSIFNPAGWLKSARPNWRYLSNLYICPPVSARFLGKGGDFSCTYIVSQIGQTYSIFNAFLAFLLP